MMEIVKRKIYLDKLESIIICNENVVKENKLSSNFVNSLQTNKQIRKYNTFPLTRTCNMIYSRCV